ncbi:hypothetical protein DL770_011207 [Monosporascus sp. CRB-9-2]|nr:hypothetical protein DL770_011207 [Monosporascus sp. CRB-9-2]
MAHGVAQRLQLRLTAIGRWRFQPRHAGARDRERLRCRGVAVQRGWQQARRHRRRAQQHARSGFARHAAMLPIGFEQLLVLHQLFDRAGAHQRIRHHHHAQHALVAGAVDALRGAIEQQQRIGIALRGDGLQRQTVCRPDQRDAPAQPAISGGLMLRRPLAGEQCGDDQPRGVRLGCFRGVRNGVCGEFFGHLAGQRQGAQAFVQPVDIRMLLCQFGTQVFDVDAFHVRSKDRLAEALHIGQSGLRIGLHGLHH